MIASATPEQYRRALEVVAADPAVDSLIAIFIPPLVTEPEAVAAAIRGRRRRDLQARRGQPSSATQGLAAAARAGAVVHVSRGRGHRARARRPLRRVAAHAGRASAEPLPEDGRDRSCGRSSRRPAPAGDGLADAVRVRARCSPAAGVPVLPIADRRAPPTRPSRPRARSGFPAVLKAVGADILHKTDVGGVRLGLASDQAVRDAFAALSARLEDRLEAVLVQPMVSGGVEMVVGGLNDPAFGPMVMCGTGGVLVDVLDDTAFAHVSAVARRMPARWSNGSRDGRGCAGSAARRPSTKRRFARLLARVSQVLARVSGDPRDGSEPGDGPAGGRGRGRRPHPGRLRAAGRAGPPHSSLRCCHDQVEHDSRAVRLQRVLGRRRALRPRAGAALRREAPPPARGAGSRDAALGRRGIHPADPRGRRPVAEGGAGHGSSPRCRPPTPAG